MVDDCRPHLRYVRQRNLTKEISLLKRDIFSVHATLRPRNAKTKVHVILVSWPEKIKNAKDPKRP